MIRKTVDNPIQTAAASASDPIFPAGLAKPEKSCRLRSGLLFSETSAWLIRNGLDGLVSEMMRLSEIYAMPWSQIWPNHLDDPQWLSLAMSQTFRFLKPEDKDLVRTMYDDWLWYERTFDMKALVTPEFVALCCLLGKDGKRVRSDKGEVTVLRGLKGQTRKEALATLDTKCYEFVKWW